MCRLFYHSLSPLLGVGGLGGSSASGLLDICVCLHAHGGSSDADARLVFVCVVFSSQPSAAGKSLCLSVLIVLEGNDAGPACSRKKNSFFQSCVYLSSWFTWTLKGLYAISFSARNNFACTSKQTRSLHVPSPLEDLCG